MADTHQHDLIMMPESPEDGPALRQLILEAYENAPQAKGGEADLVERLRQSPEYVPQLALVARLGQELVGHVMFARIYIDGAWQSLTLASIAVAPQYRGQGFGAMMIEEGHRLAVELGFVASIAVGRADYYARFGYRPLSEFVFTLPFSVRPNASMAKELVHGGLGPARGEAVFSRAFEG